MNTLTRIAAFRLLAPDDGAGGGSPAQEPAATAGEHADVVLDGPSIDAAYEAAMGAEPEADPEAEPEPEGEPVADAEPAPEGEDEPEGDEEEPAPEPEDEPTEPTGEIPAEIAEKYPAVRMFTDIEAGLMDPATAPQTLKWFVDSIARHHGTTPADLLGLAPAAPAERASEAAPQEGGLRELDWKQAGYQSAEEFQAEPEFVRYGFDSPTELKLSRELAELKALVEPVVKDRATSAKERAEAEARTRWEGAIAKVAPAAIATVKAEVGWSATPEQALEAARAFPEMASRPGGLAEAILAHNARKIATHALAAGKGQRPAPPETPQGQRPQGKAALDPTEVGYDEFARSVLG